VGRAAIAYQACLTGGGDLSDGIRDDVGEEDGPVCQFRHDSREVSRLVGPISLCLVSREVNNMSNKREEGREKRSNEKQSDAPTFLTLHETRCCHLDHVVVGLPWQVVLLLVTQALQLGGSGGCRNHDP